MLVALTIFCVLVVFVAVQSYTAENYLGQNDPQYTGNFATEHPEPAETLTVVSYNIRYGKDIDQALSELREFRAQKPLDILLLQEMDEAGTEKMARELQLNYVYFPAAIEPATKRNFGNAILSRWPIVDSQKLILPHKSFSHRMHRIATRATIRIHTAELLVYSIHTEPVFTLPQFKVDQYTAVLEDIGDEDKPVIVGGDFNSFTKASVEKVEEHY
ncbi:MAG TPA: endonuclease/exonuclease/phosphatase family protein, partial [Anaerolineales bacterium]|nr:endonuclease/exonuclease/phosphatase family protein [Anaerolineales bacterium]